MNRFNISHITIKYFFLKDEQAVKEVYNNTYRLLFHIAYSLLGRKEDAEDSVMETYLKALKYEGNKIKKPSKFISFLCSICRNTSLDLIKKKEKEILIGNEETFVTNEYHSYIIKEIEKILNKDQYDVFMYRVYFGLSYKEISSLVNKKEGRCRSIFIEAKKAIKEHKEIFYEKENF